MALLIPLRPPLSSADAEEARVWDSIKLRVDGPAPLQVAPGFEHARHHIC